INTYIFMLNISNSDLVQLQNNNLSDMTQDTLYHLAIDTNEDLPKRFGDIRFVAMGGSAGRMLAFAKRVQNELMNSPKANEYIDRIEMNELNELKNVSEKAGRYCMYKIGPVLSVNHGMGVSSLNILLHELIKLLHYAKCRNVVMFRIGTSGGLGVEPGTVVISDSACDELLDDYYKLNIMGERHWRPAIFDRSLVDELEQLSNEMKRNYHTVRGRTMCASDFYETQSRIDGAICNYGINEKIARLRHLVDNGIRNIEMEATAFASMCRYTGIRCAIVCCTLLNRLDGDQVNVDKSTLESYQIRPQELILAYIRKHL
ncbi:Uridine phosphorylase 2, partial [Blomia tropicalis]